MLDWNAILLYKGPSETENLITKKNLLKIQEYENHISEMENWKDLCKAASVESSKCSPEESFVSGLSFLKMFGIDDLEAATEDEIQTAWQRFVSNPALFANFKLLFTPKEQFIGTGKVTYMRSFLNFGAPLEINGERYNDATDRTAE